MSPGAGWAHAVCHILSRASGRKLEKFTVSVNVAAGSKVTFELTYEELLKRHKGKYEMYLKIQPKQLVKNFEVTTTSAPLLGLALLWRKAHRLEHRAGSEVHKFRPYMWFRSIDELQRLWPQQLGATGGG